MRYLCISICFLDALFHGQVDKTTGEWPPTPLRLFQSLLAGSQAGCRKATWSDAKAAAFRWLERRNPPLIVSPPAYAALGYTFFVPGNDGDKKPNRQERLTSKAVLPHRMLEGQTLHYLWQIEDSEGDVATTNAHILVQESRHLLALGWGIDMAAGYGQLLSADEAQALVGERWQSHEAGRSMDTPSRVPVENTLDNLVEVYQANVNRLSSKTFREISKPSVFKQVSYLMKTTLPPRPYAVFALVGATDTAAQPAFRQEDTVQVAAMLRHVSYEKAKQDEGFAFPGGVDFHVAGHRTNNQNQDTHRFAYLPLPSIGHPKSDGKIRRVLIAGSYNSDGTQTRWAEQRLRGAEMIGERTQETIAALAMPNNNDSVLALYVGLSNSWATVTPVTLPGFDEGNYKKALGLMAKAIAQSGISLDAVADVTLRKAPFWPSSQHPDEYFRPKYLQHHATWHAHIQFREPVYGPLAIGSGRFCGLGLFAPIN